MFKAINDWLRGSQMRLQWLLNLEATCDLINHCLQDSLVPLMMNFFFFSNLDITDWLSCFFKLHYFHLQKKKYFKYRDFPKYLLTSACYNTSNFLYLRTTISWLCTLCTWDEKNPLNCYYLWLYVHMCFWVKGFVHMYEDTTMVQGVGWPGLE